MFTNILSILKTITLTQVATSIIVVIVLMGYSNLKNYEKIQLTQQRIQNELAIAKKQKELEPVQNWFEVTSVVIPDFKFGQDPVMLVDRTIHNPFSASWTVELERISSTGRVFVCKAQGYNHYDLTAALPDPLTLSWWMFEKGFDFNRDCGKYIVLGEKYRLFTKWIVEPDEIGYPKKILKIYSNVFEIR